MKIIRKTIIKKIIKMDLVIEFHISYILNFIFLFISVIFSTHKNSYPVTNGVTYLSLTFDYVYSFVDERGKVCPSTQTDVWCDLIVHL